MALPDRLFVSTDGALYDTAAEDWSRRAPVRRRYNILTSEVTDMQDVKAALRHGPYAFPGGYPHYFVTRDGVALSFDSVRKMLYQVADDFQHDASTGWRIAAIVPNFEDDDLVCDHSGEKIPSAYGAGDESQDDDAPMAWAVGANVSGFMPDSEPVHYADWTDARRGLIDLIGQAREAYEEDSAEDAAFQTMLDALRAVPDEAEFNWGAVGYRWWLERL
ncbi:DNA ligase [Caulobacter phage CcrBL9]|uniref:Uncharacterized protein n=1 Tax=Caulobacter phage CcrBL9 TaxID=2283270 RepID=A0A385EE99_9CAUD|nr:DNA ligase [Caulobacter phage CcrBL9]YP_009810175.1 DNA ligase [Caulobacter phage CcrBL9]AXQ69029.1 hypothetical protein CcrBL9_gp005 [Caulobacter phage CcrBL9]AXQ69545.1 hypothetical protein CcrBL9_gp521 [Caulobacter phage CcrBL9]